MREPQMAKEAFMQGVRMLTGTGEPGGDGGLTIAEDPLGSRMIKPFGQGRQYHCDLMRRGFQTVQGRVAPGSEGGAASRTSKRLDALGMAMLAIPDKCMNVRVSDAEVGTLVVRTGEALSVHPFRSSPPAFDLAPGAHRCR